MARTSADILQLAANGGQAATVPPVPGAVYNSPFDSANYTPYRNEIFFNDLETHTEIDSWTRETLINKSRWCFNNVAPYTAVCRNLPMLVVGPKGLMPFPATEDREWNELALRAFNMHSANRSAFDLGGRWSFTEAQRYAYLSTLRDGDHFGVLTEAASQAGIMAFYEGHACRNKEARLHQMAATRWQDGVRLDRHGKAQAYQLWGRNGKRMLVPRENMIHFCSPERRGASRGVPIGMHWFNDGVDWTELKLYLKTAAKLRAQIGYYRTTSGRPTNGEPDPSLGFQSVNDGTDESPEHVLVKEVHKGVEILSTGRQEIKTLADDRPGPNTMEWLDRLMVQLSMGIGLPPHIIFYLSGLGSAEVRLVLQGSKAWIKTQQQQLVENFCQRWWVYVISKEIKRGALRRPRDPDWWKCGWISPSDMTIDVGREGSLKVKLRENGMLTLAMWAGELGEWWERLQDQSLREAARGARRRREIAAEEGVTEQELVAYQKGDVVTDDGESVARTIQQVYLGVGKVITIEEARSIVNQSGGNLPEGLPAELNTNQ